MYPVQGMSPNMEFSDTPSGNTVAESDDKPAKPSVSDKALDAMVRQMALKYHKPESKS